MVTQRATMYRQAMIGLVATAVTLLIAGCGDRPFDETASTPSSSDYEAPLSAQQICDVLTRDDLAPLSDDDLHPDVAPTRTETRGLPGCKWPVATGWEWFEVWLDHRGRFVETAKLDAETSFPVGDSTGFVETRVEGPSCMGFVTGPGAPAEYVLGMSVTRAGSVPETGICAAAAPQLEKLLRALGWSDGGAPSPATDVPSDVVRLSAPQMCDVLTGSDLAPLDGASAIMPRKPLDPVGLPGCRWYMGEDPGQFEIRVLPDDEFEMFRQWADEEYRTYPVGADTAHVFVEIDGSCSAAMTTGRSPSGYMLTVEVLSPDRSSTKLCESVAPQTEKVVRALGW